MSSAGSHTTIKATICNQSQVAPALDRHGRSGSKLWNVANWTSRRVWDEIEYIPEEDDLKAYLKGSDVYQGLHSQSAQRILEELAEAFRAWYGHRRNGNTNHNPPGYRKNYHTDNTTSHPRSTITWKSNGFRHDRKNNRIRLSKGKQHKSSPYAPEYILCEYEAPPGVEIRDVQQVRAVYKHGSWELHFVCRHEFQAESAGTKTAGVDLGICNFAAVSYNSEQAHLYPGNALKEDEYYFAKELAKCNDSSSRKATRLQEKRSARRSHYIHAVTTDIIRHCVEKNIGTLRVGNPKYIREDENGVPRDWGSHGNLDLHSWPFDAVLQQLKYKGAWNGVQVDAVDERDTSKTCSVCGEEAESNRVERGLYDCSQCGVVANADVNGAENIRHAPLVADGGTDMEVTQSSLTEFEGSSSGDEVVDMSTGWLAQPVVNRFRRGEHGQSSGAGTFERLSSTHEP